jgi:hypothetical protein
MALDRAWRSPRTSQSVFQDVVCVELSHLGSGRILPQLLSPGVLASQDRGKSCARKLA